MSDISSEEIKVAAEEVRRSEFGDFMFRDPGSQRNTARRNTSRNRNTSRRRTARRMTSRNRNTSRRRTSRRNTSRNRNTSRRRTSRRRTTTRRRTSRRRKLRCVDTCQGNNVITRCWEGSNMWEYRIRRR